MSSNIIIYKVSCKDPQIRHCYIDTTKNIYKTRYLYKQKLVTNKMDFLTDFIRTNGGWDNWEIIQLEKYDCITQAELDEKVKQWRILYNCTKMPQNAPNCTKNAPKCTKLHQNAPICTEMEQPKNPLQCQSCMKLFSNKFSIKRHKHGRCKAEETIESLKERLAEQQQIIDLVKLLGTKIENESQVVTVSPNANTNANNLTNSNNRTNNRTNTNTNSNNRTNTNTINTVINNNNTIRLVGLGNENIVELLSEREKKQILGKMHKSLIHLIEKVHFSGEYPQFANVVITNLKNKLAYKYSEDEQKFIVDTAEKVIQEVIDNHFDDICTIYEEQKDSLDTKINIRTGEFIEQHSNNPEKYKQATDDVRLMMYNKREKVDINTQNTQNTIKNT